MTQITLRRAAAIQIAIHEALSAIPVAPSADLSLFSVFPQEVEDHRNKAMSGVKRSSNLISTLFAIRALVAEANVASGINGILARQAEAEMQMKVLKALADATPHEGADITAKRAERLATREEPGSVYGRPSAPTETLRVNLLTQAQIDSAQGTLATYRKAKLALKDRLAELNASTRITLTKDIEDVLIEENIL